MGCNCGIFYLSFLFSLFQNSLKIMNPRINDSKIYSGDCVKWYDKIPPKFSSNFNRKSKAFTAQNKEFNSIAIL